MRSVILLVSAMSIWAAMTSTGLQAAAPQKGGEPISRIASRETVCIQPGMLDAVKIPADTTEVANDCEVPDARRVIQAIWWGGYTEWEQGDPDITSFDVRFYSNIACTPDMLLAEYLSATPDTTQLGDCMDSLPCFRYELDVDVDVPAGSFWFSVMVAADDRGRYPPKWGRLGDDLDQGCFTVWRVAGGDEWEVPPLPPDSDASQAFEVEEATPAGETSWGSIKQLYR